MFAISCALTIERKLTARSHALGPSHADLVDRLPKMRDGERNRLLRTIIDRVLIEKSGQAGRRGDPRDRIRIVFRDEPGEDKLQLGQEAPGSRRAASAAGSAGGARCPRAPGEDVGLLDLDRAEHIAAGSDGDRDPETEPALPDFRGAGDVGEALREEPSAALRGSGSSAASSSAAVQLVRRAGAVGCNCCPTR